MERGPLTQENNSTTSYPAGPGNRSSMLDSQEGHVGKELGNGNVLEKHDEKDDAFSTLVDQCPLLFPLGKGNGGELDSILFLDEKETSAVIPDHIMNEVLQKELLQLHHGRPLYDSDHDYSFSLIQVSNTSMAMPVEKNAKTDELDSSFLMFEPVERPNIEVGSLLESRLLNYPIDDNSLCAALEDSDELLDLLLQDRGILHPSGHEKTKDDQTDLSLDVAPDQQEGSADEPPASSVNAEITKGRNCRLMAGLQSGNKEIQADKEEGSTVKKLKHNAKERERRMKLHASYLALGALLPDSSRSKKWKTAPRIIDRAVEYIPELEEEIEKLTLRRNDMLSKIKNKQPLNQNPRFELQDPSVSVHEIKQGEFIIQICTQRRADDGFSKLLQKVEEEEEEEGMSILSASTLQVSDDRVCYHLHIQTNGSTLKGANQLTSLKEKVISWLH